MVGAGLVVGTDDTVGLGEGPAVSGTYVWATAMGHHMVLRRVSAVHSSCPLAVRCGRTILIGVLVARRRLRASPW